MDNKIYENKDIMLYNCLLSVLNKLEYINNKLLNLKIKTP